MARKTVMKGEVVETNSRAVATLRPAEPATPMQMLQDALQRGAGIDVMERLLTLQERWEANQARKEFEAAMAALRPDLPTIAKNAEVDFTSTKGRTNYKYEDLGSVIAAIAPAMGKHGLSFRWKTEQPSVHSVKVTCILSHAGGHSERTDLTAVVDESGNKNSIQAIGSTVAYLQRYTLKAAVGIAASNDTDAGEVRKVSKAEQEGGPRQPTTVHPPVAAHPQSTEPISDKQRMRLWTISRKRGRADEEVHQYLAGLRIAHSKEITRDRYDDIVSAIEASGPLPTVFPAPVMREAGQEG